MSCRAAQSLCATVARRALYSSAVAGPSSVSMGAGRARRTFSQGRLIIDGRPSSPLPRCSRCSGTTTSTWPRAVRRASTFAPAADDVLGQYALESARKRERLLAEISDAADGGGAELQERAGQFKELEAVHRIWQDWIAKEEHRANASKLAESDPDPEMRTLAEEELSLLDNDIDALRASLLDLILPDDPMDDSDAIMELRPGVGGEEACIFTGEILRMYTKFCESRPDGFTTELLSVTEVDVSTAKASSGEGYKEAIMEIKGKGAYGLLKWEAGVHRVQRVPATQSTGRLQTSAMAVVVLPVIQDNKEQDNELFEMKDVKVEVMRSRGAGGQHVNKTESAVRLTHEPTGITVSMQDSRSQHQNRTKAFAILRARLMDRRMREQMSSARAARQGQIGTMDRGDRIRTYNFPQDRVTDHRVGISLTGIEDIMDGIAEDGLGLSRLLDALQEQNRERRLQAMLDELRAEAEGDDVDDDGGTGRKGRKR